MRYLPDSKFQRYTLQFYRNVFSVTRRWTGSILKTLTYPDFIYVHWSKLGSNNVIERLNRKYAAEPVVGTFQDGNSTLMDDISSR